MCENFKENEELFKLVATVKLMVSDEKYQECEELILDSLRLYPHAPQPHNLLGMIFELKSQHDIAMKHFRAAYSLDPTYLPAKHNMELYGNFGSNGRGAFDESDCPKYKDKGKYKVEYDRKGIGHVLRRSNNEPGK